MMGNPTNSANRMLHTRMVWWMVLSSSFSISSARQTSFLFNPSTKLAAVTLDCEAGDEVLEIVSVRYRYYRTDCGNHCSHRTDRPVYLDGSSTECRNEENIISICYARSSCTITNITQPYTACPGGNLPTHVRVDFSCISSGYVFNLCEKRYALITEETPIIFTTPFTPTVGSSRSTCECSLRSSIDIQVLSPQLNLARVKLAQLRNGDQLYYNYMRSVGPLRIISSDAQPYISPYWLDERVLAAGSYNPSNITIALHRPSPLVANSRVFITVRPGKDLIINCNNAVHPLRATTEATFTVQPSIEVSDGSETSANIMSERQGHGNESTSLCIGNYKRKLEKMESVIIGLAVCCGCFVLLSTVLGILYGRKLIEKTTPKTDEPRENPEPSTYEMLAARTEPAYSQLAVRDTKYDDAAADHAYADI